MKKTLWISALLAAAVVGVAAVCGWWLTRAEEATWTTDSPRALEEMERGFDALMKHYWMEAATHLERAVSLDPDFAVAKLLLVYSPHIGAEERAHLLEELRGYDTSRLSERERFLVEFWLARHGGEEARALETLERYRRDRPDDLFALEATCDLAWGREDWDAAERCYQRMIELHPNWVDAQSRLGSVSMARGNFEEAEERFRTYRYIAPDQALPHDALGQLRTLLGRYEEAEADLLKALEVKPDFCDGHRHLVRLYGMWDRLEEAEVVLDRLEGLEACRYLQDWHFRCMIEIWLEYLRGDLEAAWQVGADLCPGDEEGGFKVFNHRAAVFTGRRAEALALERRLEREIEELPPEAAGEADYARAALYHMRGTRELAEGEAARAVASLARADSLLTFWEGEQGNFKQFNRLNLAVALERAGRAEKAAAVRAQVADVNPRFARHARLPELERP